MDSLSAQISQQVNGYERSFIEIFEEKRLVQTLKGRTDLINILGYVSFMSQVTVAALEAFQKHQWRQFDALVGENACQLRAAKIKDLADLYLNFHEWQQEIDKACSDARTILKQLPAIKSQITSKIHSGKEFKAEYGNKISPREACEKLKILHRASDNVRFVVESYLLAQTKTLVPKNECFYQLFDVTHAENLARFNCSLEGQTPNEESRLIGSKKLGDLVNLLQCDLALQSIKYLQRELWRLGETRETPVNQFAHKVISEGIRRDKVGRRCSPCFYNLETLIQRLIDKKQHLLIDVTRWTPQGKEIDRIKMLYEPDQVTHSFKKMSLNEEILPESVFVIIGTSIREDQEQLPRDEYLKMFDSYSLEEILNANWAQHAQYPGDLDKTSPLPDDGRRLALAKQAQEIGCSKANMSLFTVSHILCDRLDAALENMEML